MTALAVDWTHPQSIGYPVLFFGVLLGSVVPVVPTGAVVGAAAAIAVSSGRLSLPLVLLLATAAAWLGDVITFAVAKGGRAALVRWVARGQTEERLATARSQFAKRGWVLVVVGRLIPAGRIPVLLAAGAVNYPWRRLLAAAALACFIWSVAYAVLGVVSGGLFDNPVIATLIAAVLVLVVTLVASLVVRRRERSRRREPVSTVDKS